MKNVPFNKTETGYHKSAVEILAKWVHGVIEHPFKVDGKIIFVPDVTVFINGKPDCIYEVLHTHSLNGKKYGLIQYWCYKNLQDLTVHEVSSDFILSQTKEPEIIRDIDCYIVDIFEYGLLNYK